MCDTLVRHGSDYTNIKWIRANLEGRFTVTNLNGFSKRLTTSRCCLQGGELSLLLW